MLSGNVDPIVLKCQDISFDRLPDVADRQFSRLALRNTAWKTRAFSHPESIFAGINDCLSHGQTIGRIVKKLNSFVSMYATQNTKGCPRASSRE